LIDSRRPENVDPLVEVVGLAIILLEGENGAIFEFSGVRRLGPNGEFPCGDWNGFPVEGTDNLRPGVLCPYRLAVLEWDEIGDCMPDPHRGLLLPVEKVADVGVLKPPGE
jgi:hypothetical protein